MTRVLNAYLAAEDAFMKLPRGDKSKAAEAAQGALSGRLYDMEGEMAWRRAETAEGALYATVAANAMVVAMIDFDMDKDELMKSLHRLQRLLYSARNGIEKAVGLDADTMTGHYFMTRRSDPFEHLEKAISAYS